MYRIGTLIESILPTPRNVLFVRWSVRIPQFLSHLTQRYTRVSMCVRFWVTRPERLKGTMDEVKEGLHNSNDDQY